VIILLVNARCPPPIRQETKEPDSVSPPFLVFFAFAFAHQNPRNSPLAVNVSSPLEPRLALIIRETPTPSESSHLHINCPSHPSISCRPPCQKVDKPSHTPLLTALQQQPNQAQPIPPYPTTAPSALSGTRQPSTSTVLRRPLEHPSQPDGHLCLDSHPISAAASYQVTSAQHKNTDPRNPRTISRGGKRSSRPKHARPFGPSAVRNPDTHRSPITNHPLTTLLHHYHPANFTSPWPPAHYKQTRRPDTHLTSNQPANPASPLLYLPVSARQRSHPSSAALASACLFPELSRHATDARGRGPPHHTTGTPHHHHQVGPNPSRRRQILHRDRLPACLSTLGTACTFSSEPTQRLPLLSACASPADLANASHPIPSHSR
jgi:hypothetical protein